MIKTSDIMYLSLYWHKAHHLIISDPELLKNSMEQAAIIKATAEALDHFGKMLSILDLTDDEIEKRFGELTIFKS